MKNENLIDTNKYIKLKYPDGDVEFWTCDSPISELKRLQKLHNNKIEIEYIEVRVTKWIFMNTIKKPYNTLTITQ